MSDDFWKLLRIGTFWHLITMKIWQSRTSLLRFALFTFVSKPMCGQLLYSALPPQNICIVKQRAFFSLYRKSIHCDVLPPTLLTILL